jgi:hypothetical protein
MKKLFALVILILLAVVAFMTQVAKPTPKSRERAASRSLTEYREVARKPSAE